MKKLLVSDYDGTFNIHNNRSVIDSNIDAVKRFIDNGNIFSLASARSFNSLKREIDKYKIPYNYLVCNNGGVVFDKDDNIIFFHPVLNSSLLKTLKYLNKLGILKRILFKDFYGNITTDLNEVCDIICTINTDNLDKLNQIQEELNYLCSTPFFHLLVFSEKMDKVDGIDIIACKESITEEAIYTVGNDFFDKNMLLRYNGYRMINSNPLLYRNGIRKAASVKSLVRRL